jgi:transketolase
MNTLGFNVKENNTNPALWIDAILSKITRDDEKYVCAKMEKNAEQIQKESDLIQKIRTSLRGRPIFNPLNIRRPRKLPDELTFSDGEKIATRKAAQQFFKWLMKQTAFCWIGAGDVSKSVLTDEAEKEYGIISPKNPLGRGIRFGIAEQNMAMMSLGMTHDILPGDFKPFSVFGTFAEFTPMIGNCVRLALINNGANPDKKSFFVAIASHDGPETGEDGPTHQGLYWMSYFDALPGIKVYKPLDAQETIEMLFYAIEKGEPIALSLSREALPLFDRQKYGASNPKDACNGAYIFKPFENNLKKKMVLVVSGGFAMKNTLDALPAISEKYNTKIVAVTSPKLFEELRKENPNDAEEIFSYDEIKITRTIHNGWKGFLNNFLLPENYEQKSVGVECYLKSGTPKDLYELAGLDSKSIIQKILSV